MAKKSESDPKSGSTEKKAKVARPSAGGPRFRTTLTREVTFDGGQTGTEALKFAGSPRISGGYTLNVRKHLTSGEGDDKTTTLTHAAKEQSFDDFESMKAAADKLVDAAVEKGWSKTKSDEVDVEALFD